MSRKCGCHSEKKTKSCEKKTKSCEKKTKSCEKKCEPCCEKRCTPCVDLDRRQFFGPNFQALPSVLRRTVTAASSGSIVPGFLELAGDGRTTAAAYGNNGFGISGGQGGNGSFF